MRTNHSRRRGSAPFRSIRRGTRAQICFRSSRDTTHGRWASGIDARESVCVCVWHRPKGWRYRWWWLVHLSLQVDKILGSDDPTAIVQYGKQLEVLLAHSLSIGGGGGDHQEGNTTEVVGNCL